MRLSDLLPFPTFVNWEGKPIELKPFSLRAITWAERFFYLDDMDGFERMNRILSGQFDENIFFNSLIDIVYYLGEKDFSKYGVETTNDLKLKITAAKDKFKIIGHFKTQLEEVLVNSFPPAKKKEPEKKGGSIYEALKSQQKKAEHKSAGENWDQVYIEFFKAGGMSIDQFMDMTRRQIEPLIQEIRYRHHEDLNILSELIHKKISVKKPQRVLPEMEFTEQEDKMFEKLHQQLVEKGRIN